MFNGTTYHNIRRLGFFQVLGLGVDPCVPALGHWLAPVPTFRVFATRTGEQGSKSARRKHVDLAAFLVVVLGIRSDGHDSALKTKRDGSLAKRHVGALERVGQEVGMFRGVGIGVRKPNGDDMTLGKEVWFLESGLNGLVQRQRLLTWTNRKGLHFRHCGPRAGRLRGRSEARPRDCRVALRCAACRHVA
jgi:hypothetical protein